MTHHVNTEEKMYYVYLKRNGMLLLKTTDKSKLTNYIPELVDIVVY